MRFSADAMAQAYIAVYNKLVDHQERPVSATLEQV
jgi:hypothetical protein